MANLEVLRTKNEGSGFNYSITSEGLSVHADFDPTTGEAQVRFDEVKSMAAALGAVVDTLTNQARVLGTNPLLSLRIDIKAGKFAKSLQQVAPRFGFSGQQRAGEFATVDQFTRFRGEFPLAGQAPRP